MASDVSMRVYRNNETTKGSPPLDPYARIMPSIVLQKWHECCIRSRSGTNVALGLLMCPYVLAHSLHVKH